MKKCLILLVILGLVIGSVSANDPELFDDIGYLELDEEEYVMTDGGLGPVVAIAVSAGVGAASGVIGYVATTKLTGGKITTGGVIASAVVGAGLGFLGSAKTIGEALIGITGAYIGSLGTTAATGIVSGVATGAIQGSIDGELTRARR